ncbi:MAG: hypothetical protein WCA84_16265 [Ignavibacteriaceae bacterium]|jgi:hypothetical protein
MKNFKDKLTNMSLPEINNLRHEELLAKVITSAHSKTAISFWWIIIPLYVIAAFVMKSFFVTHSTLRSNLRELADKTGYLTNLLFILMPVILIVTNMLSIKNIYFLSGSPKTIKFLSAAVIQIIIIFISLIIILVYIL